MKYSTVMHEERNTDMVPSHKIIADRFEFIFSHPLLDLVGW